MPQILFVCTANRFRSPLAAAMFQKLLQANGCENDWQVESAGTWVERPLPAMPEALVEASKRGLDLSKHLSKGIETIDLEKMDLIVVMETGHKEAIKNEFPQLKDMVFLLSEIGTGAVYSIPDPYATTEPTDLIASEIEALLQQFLIKMDKRVLNNSL